MGGIIRIYWIESINNGRNLTQRPCLCQISRSGSHLYFSGFRKYFFVKRVLLTGVPLNIPPPRVADQGKYVCVGGGVFKNIPPKSQIRGIKEGNTSGGRGGGVLCDIQWNSSDIQKVKSCVVYYLTTLDVVWISNILLHLDKIRC